MEELEGAYIEYIHAVPEKTEKGWNVKLAVKVVNLEDAEKIVELQVAVDGLFEITKEVNLKAGEEALVEETVDAGTPDVWEMDHPVLYTICAVLSDADGAFDDLADRIGFREIKTAGKDILLNGKKLRIKGFCRHRNNRNTGSIRTLHRTDMSGRLQTVHDRHTHIHQNSFDIPDHRRGKLINRFLSVLCDHNLTAYLFQQNLCNISVDLIVLHEKHLHISQYI